MSGSSVPSARGSEDGGRVPPSAGASVFAAGAVLRDKVSAVAVPLRVPADEEERPETESADPSLSAAADREEGSSPLFEPRPTRSSFSQVISPDCSARISPLS